MSVSHAQLKAFHAVAIHGSFTGAAERLFLTQPAISDQVRKLEERFGVLLFHRNKRSVRLTDLGERLLAITQRLFVIEAEAEELLQDSRALLTGTLTLAVDAPDARIAADRALLPTLPWDQRENRNRQYRRVAVASLQLSGRPGAVGARCR